MVTRTRECSGSSAHRFNTHEGGGPGRDLRRIAVRQSGSGALAPTLFDEDRLLRDVANGVFLRLTDARIQEAVDDAVAGLARRAEINREFSGDERDHLDGTVEGWIWDAQIADEVEAQLLRRDRMAAVLYALSTRGRRDREGRTGWSDARDVLGWLQKQHPHLSVEQLPSPFPVAEQQWTHPGAPAPRPRMLIKRSQSSNIRERMRRFDYEQFTRSIRLALLGRFEAPDHDRRVELIAEWVLWGLAGQEVILSSQLAVAVLDCLRRIDDVAYLRWAAIIKSIDSVAEFADEARALAVYPSPRLELVGTPHLGRYAPDPVSERAP